MLMRHASAGVPLTRTRTGSGLRQSGLMVLAREALTRMKGWMPLILRAAVKVEVVIGVSNPTSQKQLDPWRVQANQSEAASIIATSLPTVFIFRTVTAVSLSGSLSLDRPMPSG